MSEPEVINPAEAKLIEFKKDPMKELSLEVIEKVIVGGDLSVLNTKERLDYVNAVCKSVGLNPLTRPLEYIKLNGRLTLYARKDCTDQLRKIHNVSVDELKEFKDDDILTVTAYVSMPSGRKDVAKGAMTIEKMKGETLAIALMKCETKAKRRATLSICGLGFLDESELEYVDAETPQVTEKKKKRETGSLEKLKESKSDNRGHGNEGIAAALNVEGVQKGTDNLPYETLTCDIERVFYHESKDESKKWLEVVFVYKLNGNLIHVTIACWHRSLFECLMKKPKNVVLTVKNLGAHKGSPSIEDVLSVDGVKYVKGVPEVISVPSEPIVEHQPKVNTPDEQARRNESLLDLSQTLEKLWPAKDSDLRPIRNSVGQLLFNLQRKEQLMDLSYPQIIIDAALMTLKRYIDLKDKPSTSQGIQNEISNMFISAKEELEAAKIPPPGDLFA